MEIANDMMDDELISRIQSNMGCPERQEVSTELVVESAVAERAGIFK